MSDEQQKRVALFKVLIKRLDGIDQIAFLGVQEGQMSFPVNIDFIHQESKQILTATLVGVSKRTETPVFQEYIKEEQQQ